MKYSILKTSKSRKYRCKKIIAIQTELLIYSISMKLKKIAKRKSPNLRKKLHKSKKKYMGIKKRKAIVLTLKEISLKSPKNPLDKSLLKNKNSRFFKSKRFILIRLLSFKRMRLSLKKRIKISQSMQIMVNLQINLLIKLRLYQ